jgi:uncharacterized membrane protein YhiD involved in acid resistance
MAKDELAAYLLNQLFMLKRGCTAPPRRAALLVLLLTLFSWPWGGETVVAQEHLIDQQEDPQQTPDRSTQLDHLRQAATRVPLAAGLAFVLAMRPRRRGTPARQVHVVETQIILAIVGAVVMLVVGASLARAFGIVGAAGLVRYRSKIDDPKDAGVMLSTLAVGLAAGVGLWMLAIFATMFVMGVLGVIESFEPKASRAFSLEIKAKDPSQLKSKVEQYLSRGRLDYRLRATSDEEISYDVGVPFDRKTDRIADQIAQIDPANAKAVEFKEKKNGNKE